MDESLTKQPEIRDWCPHLYKDLNPPQRPGSNSCTRLRVLTRQWEEERWTLCLHHWCSVLLVADWQRWPGVRLLIWILSPPSCCCCPTNNPITEQENRQIIMWSKRSQKTCEDTGMRSIFKAIQGRKCTICFLSCILFHEERLTES